MGIPSQYPVHVCKKCKTEIKKGDLVNKRPAGNWCSNDQCPLPATTTAAPAPETVVDDKPKSATFRNFVREQSHKLQEIEAIVLETTPEETRKNGQKVGMYVKEIYRTWTTEQWKKLELGLD